MDGTPHVVRFDATTLWHLDAAEWAPSTASNAVSNQKTWAGRALLRRVLRMRPARAGCRAVRDSTLVAWYHFLYAPRTGGAYDSLHRTAGIAGRTRRRGGGVAARGARAAAGDAGYLGPGSSEFV